MPYYNLRPLSPVASDSAAAYLQLKCLGCGAHSTYEAARIDGWTYDRAGPAFAAYYCAACSAARFTPVEDRPLAAKGLLSYRYRGNFDWIMIGALDDEDALKSAQTSLSSGVAHISRLEKWNGERYVPCEEPGSP